MEIKEFIASLEKLNFSLSVENGNLNLKGDKSKLTKEEIAAIKVNKEVIDYIKANKNELIQYLSATPEPSSKRKTANISSIYRLSGLQEGMLFYGLYSEAEAYIEQVCCNISNVNLLAFEESWNYVLKQHSILRSAFFYDEFNVAVQAVYKEVKLPLEVMDYTSLDDISKDIAIKEYENAQRVKGFEFKEPPLMRIGLLKIAPSQYRLVWTSHHLLFDGWSMPIILEEFLTTYELLLAGRPANVKEEDKYEDYIKYLDRTDKALSQEYWTKYLKNLQQNTLLPFISNTAERTKGEGEYKSLSLDIDRNISEEIQRFAKKYRLTINTIMQGVWSLLLHHYTSSKNIVYGVIVSGRPDNFPGVEQRVGLYINTLPLYSSINDEASMIDWLQGIQNDQVKSRQHQYTALHEIKRWTGVQGDLFDSLLVFENYPVSKLVSANKWSLRFDSVEMHEHTNYPLTLLVNSSDDIHIQFSYNSALLSEFYITEIKKHFKNVLLQLVNSSIKSFNEVSLLTTSEKDVLINAFNNRQISYPKDKTIVTLIEDQVQKTPDNIAVVFQNQEITYRELNERANRITHLLHSKGVRPETLVPICIERRLEMIIGILGILKAGGAYVPIDPDYPEDRIAYMLNDISAKIVLTSGKSKASITSTSGVELIEIDDSDSLLKEQPNTNPLTNIQPSNLAYIIYTSGSTGRPKGVMIEHENVVRLFKTDEPLYDFNENDVWSLFHSFSFDFSVWEIFGALFYGGKLVVVSKEVTRDASQFADLILREKVSILNQTPSAFYVLQDQLVERATQVSVRYVIFGGEALNPVKLKPWKQYYPSSRLVNMYGITETTVHVTYQPIDSDEIESGISVIGKPIPTLSCIILDETQNVVPVGVAGELYIGGAGVARGYLNKPELTREKFIADPFDKEEDSRLYRTGDLGRWLPDGNIEYLGRIDDQVKIRGYRIELGEIETALQQSGLVVQSVVVAREDTRGNKRLVSYVVCDGPFNTDAITAYLKTKLPDYMVPGVWVELEKLPLTSNGKIDRKALPNPDVTTLNEQEYVAPKNETEKKLVGIWQELLGVDKVGTQDNFFELGGHSILAMQVISSVRRKLKLEASIKDLFSNPTIASFSDSLLGAGNQTSQPGITTVFPRPENIPLSFGQERLWFIDQLEGSVSYHIPAVFRLKGKLDIVALTFSIRKIIEHHEILRTVITENNGQPFQKILPSEAWNLNVYDGSDEYSNNLKQRIQQLISSPFDLSKDYMLRADLITLSDSENILVVNMHHIASDGWSLSVIVKEVVELYKAFVEQRNANLNALPIQYADYSIWQRTHLQGEVLDHKLNYWKQKLQGAGSLNLPTDYARPAIQSTSGGIEYFFIEKEVLQKLHSLGQRHDATLFMSLLAAFKVLLYRYTGQEDVCVGTPTANRTYKELENLIGLFLNTLALRNTVKGQASFVELLTEVRKTTLDAYEHQDVPFEKVVEAVVKERDLTRNALFQVMFILQNTPDVPVLKLGDVELSTETFEDKTSKFDLTFNVRETASGLQGLVHYRTDLFKKTTIQRLLGHFKQLLIAVTENPLEKISGLSFLSNDETTQILKEFNKPLSPLPHQKSLVNLFEEQALTTPENIALVSGGRSLTYSELNRRANRLAHFLASQNIGTETIVPICIDRSFEMMIGVLAVLKSGAAYVPVDPDYPLERIGFMLSDTNASIVLSTSTYVEKLQHISKGPNIIALDREWQIVEKYSSNNPNRAITAKDLAYVLYTSGSTGKPKGVQIEHASIAQHLSWFCNQYNITERDSTILISSFSFDGAMTAIWPVLLKGGSLHLPTDPVFDPSNVLAYISQNNISYLKTLPGIFRELVYDQHFATTDIAKSLRLIILGGEKINMTDLRKYLSYYPDVTFSNHYGPTECTVSSSFYIINKENVDKATLYSVVGKAVDNATVYVVNEDGLLNPIGVEGEIWIGGTGVARGYLNADDLTKEKFIADPFSDKQGARVYKTGDLGRWSEDGNLEFIGRKDEQLKVRGYRVEPGEIEDALQQSTLVREAVVAAQEDHAGNSILVAYIVPTEAYDQSVLSASLKNTLPGYMIPSLWVEMEALPLSPNGKVDRKSLPKPNGNRQMRSGFQAPRDQVEQVIANCWQELLNIERVSIYDNFFEIGGHSLLALRVVASIRKQLHTELSIKTIFLYPTIEGLAQYVRQQEKASLLPAIEVGQRPEKTPLSFGQERLWFMDKLQGSVQFHIPTVLKLKGKLRLEGLKYAFQNIQNRHEILRTVILENDNGEGYQKVLPKNDASIAVVDGANYGEDEKGLQAYIEQLINAPFDLSKDPMLRAVVIKLQEDEHILVITMHHIASDGWSTSIFVKEMVELYECYVQERECALPPLQLQYADYAVWQRNYIKGDILDQKIDYWKKRLNGIEPLDLATDHPRSSNKTRKGRTQLFSIDKQLEDQIKELCKKQECTLFMALLAAFNILLNRYSGKNDICVGTSTGGRQHQEFESLIGLFVNLLAIRTSVNNDDSFAAFLKRVKETTLEAYEHQEVPFEKVVDAVVEEREMGRSPIFQVMLVVLNTPESSVAELTDLSISGVEYNLTSSKYDIILSFKESQKGMAGSIEYDVDLFDEKTILRMIANFKKLLHSIVSDQNMRIGDLKMVTDAEVRQVTIDFNATESEYPANQTIVELFEKQVAERRAATALVFGDQQISYEKLNSKANVLAHYLRSKGVVKETLVPIFLERSVEMIVSILAILKAGGAYVPIDTQYPLDRIRFVLEDTNAAIVLTKSKHREVFATATNVDVVELDTDFLASLNLTSTNLTDSAEPHNLAYVIYTSGSTGRPKGVLVEHKNIVSLVMGANYVSLDNKDILLSTGSPAFDATTFEYWSMLLNGGQLVISSENTLLDIELLKKEIAAKKVNIMWFTSSWFNQIVESDITVFENLETVLVGGEKLSEKHINIVRETHPSLEIINGYGPTENTTFSLTYAIKEKEIRNAIPIGKPLSNRKAYILDGQKHLNPIGVVGEIYVGGAGVARGYLNRPELTAEKFIDSPFDEKNSSRLYRTGDLGRWSLDGNIEYIGRIDDQVKIRGYRIELGEIEAVLQGLEEVRHAVVLARVDGDGTKKLIAYVVPEDDFDKNSLQQQLKSKLPEYMVPSVIMYLNEIPLNSNGKVDRKALPDPHDTNTVKGEFVAPASSVEKALASIWQNLLDVESIGTHDNFFEMGGDSLLAIRVVSAIRKELQVELPINLLFENQTIAQLAAQINASREVSVLPAIKAGNRPANIPLSFSQQRLWFIDRMEGSLQYHLAEVMRLKGGLNKEALTYALSTIVERHEVLRTIYHEHEGVPVQVIKEAAGFELGTVEGTLIQNDTNGLKRVIQKLISTPFDLSKDNMLRADLIALGEEDYLLVLTIHHIASDGWSRSILVKEVVELYSAFEEGRKPALPILPIQYADFSIWQRSYLQGENLDEKLGYWAKKLEGVEAVQMPTDFPRPAIRTIRGGSIAFDLDRNVANSLQNLAQQNGATLFMTLLACLKVLINRYTSNNDVCIGTAIAGRQQQELEGLIGFFVNTLALRTEVKTHYSFTDLLAQVKSTTLDAYKYQDVPFEKVVDSVITKRDLSQNPIVQIMCVLQNTPDVPKLKLGKLQLLKEDYVHNTSQFDLSFSFIEHGYGLSGSVVYNADLYLPETIERLVDHFRQLINSIIKDPFTSVNELEILSIDEKLKLQAFNSTQISYPKDETIVTLIEKQVQKAPQSVALLFEDKQITYKELNERSNQLAHYLQQVGIGAETLVPICIERGTEMVIGILGILKAGAAYVPIDPAYPAERIAFMLEDTAASVVVTNWHCGKTLPVFTADVTVVELDQIDLSELPKDNLNTIIDGHQLAYVIYTSGSTGKPKGVLIEHANAYSFIRWCQDEFASSDFDTVYASTSICFDLSVYEIFYPLTIGRQIRIIENGLQISKFLPKDTKVLTNSVPVVIDNLLKEGVDLGNVSVINMAGEPIPLHIVQRLNTERIEVRNLYGPTEDTTYSTVYRIKNDRPVLIGKPISSTQIYIVTAGSQLAPVGVIGEIYIGGTGVARGYLNRAELTQKKFVRNLFGNDEGGRLYKTGDLGRWLPDGNIEYLGRVDDQVKIRGYRIELGEIVTVIRESGLVEDVVVAMKEKAPGIKQLVGYVVAEEAFDLQALKSYLRHKLPDYMIPAAWVQLNDIPLTSNGKVDKTALPGPDVSEQLANQYAAPENETEQQLAEIWGDLLGLEKVGVNNNFFELGGDSLMIMRLRSQIHLKLKVELEIRDLFQYSTIRELSKFLDVQPGNRQKQDIAEEFDLLVI